MSTVVSSPLGEQERDLGNATDLEIIEQLIPLAGLSLVDVGCGGGTLARQMAERGATVLGVEPDPSQAALNALADPIPNLTLIQATAEQLPLSPQSVDGIFFMKSLHHVPEAQLDRALLKAVECLKPEGFLYISEPDIQGQFSQLIQPFHDETRVRQLAMQAMDRTLTPRFQHRQTYRYTTISSFESFAAFEHKMRGNTFNDYGGRALDTPQIRAGFEAGGDGEVYRFHNLMRLRLYQGPSAP